MYLAYKAAIPYCMSYKKDRLALYQNEAMRMERELLAFVSMRNKDVKKHNRSLKPTIHNSKSNPYYR